VNIDGCHLIEPQVFEDERGYFFESFNKARFRQQTGHSGEFVQDNQSYSVYGVIRGLHFQTGAKAQAKLVRVIEGRIWDVFVDLRKESPTYGQWTGVELSADNRQQLFLPAGFAHGFSVLSPGALVAYKCDAYYDAAAEGGIKYNDPDLAIDWKVPAAQQLVSAKDQLLPNFQSLN